MRFFLSKAPGLGGLTGLQSGGIEEKIGEFFDFEEEEIEGRNGQAGFHQFDGHRFPQTFEIKSLALGEVNKGSDCLFRAKWVFAPPCYDRAFFAFRVFTSCDGGSAGRAFPFQVFVHGEGSGASGALLGDHFENLGDDLTGFVSQHGVPDADVALVNE